MKKTTVGIFLMLVSIGLFSGCVVIERNAFVCAGVIDSVFVDGTMASITFVNGTCKGITFYPHPNEEYDCFVFDLLEKGAMYTFSFHLEDNVARPGIDMYYIDDAPVIDHISRGYHVDYWVDDRGAELWGNLVFR